MFDEPFKTLVSDLRALQCRWALVGGWAVGVRAEARFTADIDVAIAVADDAEAEKILFGLRSRGYQIDMLLEHETRERLATARTLITRTQGEPIRIDFLFASSGVENEIVAQAEVMTIVPAIDVPVAQRGHLVALKLLSNADHRAHDGRDLQLLARYMTTDDWSDAEQLVRLIEERGYQRGKDLLNGLTELRQVAGRETMRR